LEESTATGLQRIIFTKLRLEFHEMLLPSGVSLHAVRKQKVVADLKTRKDHFSVSWPSQFRINVQTAA